MSDTTREVPNSMEKRCDSPTPKQTQPNSSAGHSLVDSQVNNEMPLLVYSYLKSSGFEAMADEFLSENIINKYPIKKYNLSGQPIDMNLDECKVLADSIEPSRLTDIVSSMKGFVEKVHQTDNVKGTLTNQQTYNCSLITPAQRELNKFMDPSNIHKVGGTTSQLRSVKSRSVKVASPANLAHLLATQKFTGRCDLKKLYSACEPFKNLRLMKRVLGHISAIYCFTLDRTKCTLFTGGEDGLVKIWNLEKCVLVATLRGHVKAVNDLSINHHNDRLASCGVDGTIRIWCLESCGLLYTLRNGHNCAVMSVCFSPYPVGRYRYIISTGQNGTLCFYKIDHDDQINPNPIKFAEKQPNKHFRINCFTVSPGGTYVALGVTDPTIRVYKMGIKGPVRTMELYGHSDEVESVEFDNYGSRFCSGSKDGTICIWTLSITSWKCAQIDVKSDMITAVKNKPSGSKKKNNCTINLVSWSCDNKRICCACADFAIRTYDSCSRELISRFSVHTDKVTVLHHHPTVGNLLLSSGCDGRIYLWNSDTGTVLVCLDNNLGEQGFGSIYDLAFISNGRDFVMCDYHGNWAIYSSLPTHILDHIPNNQFFHSDYWEIREDPATGKVVDVLSLLEPHLMPPPVMVNYFGIPYSNEVQKLIPGAALLNKETEFNYNHINLTHDTSVSGPGLATSGSVEGVRKTGIINKKNRSNLNCSLLMWFRRLIVNKLSKMDINEDFQTRLQIYKHEQSIHNNIRHRPSEFYDKEERVGRLLHLQSIQKERQLEKQARRVVALPIPNSGDDDQPPNLNNSNENSMNSDYADYVSRNHNHASVYDRNANEYDETFQYLAAIPSERNSDPEFIDESDEFLLEESLPIRTNRSARLRSLRPRTSAGSAFSNRRNGVATRSSGPSAEGVANMQDNPDVVEVPAPPPPLPDDYPSLWVSNDLPKISPYVPQLGDQVYYFIQGHRLYLQELFRQNLTNLLPSVNAYEEYDRFIVPEVNSNGYELCRVLDIQYIYKNPLVCKIKLKRLEMERYAESLDKCDNAYKRDCFVLEFHDMTNILDFIVLREVVDTALKREWSASDRFKSIIDDCWWYGCVESCSVIDPEFPLSPHLSYVVRWDTGEYDRVSPWDMECINSSNSLLNLSDKKTSNNYDSLMDDDNNLIVDSVGGVTSKPSSDDESTESVSSSQGRNNLITPKNVKSTLGDQHLVVDPVSISQDEMRSLCERYIIQAHINNEDAWQGEQPFVACERIATAVENFKNHYIAYAFSMPVDLVTFADYWTIVPHPMDLGKVVSRLTNHYYRSKDAIIFDIKLIKLNALSYNRTNTPISHCACTLLTLIEDLIRNNDRFEVNLKHPLLAGKRYPTDVSGPSTVKSTKRIRRKKFVRFSHYSDESDEEQQLQLNKNPRLGTNDMMVEWINDAFDLLNYLMNLKDSECFLNPVDVEEYPEYTQFVRYPMDFNTVLNKLRSGTYIHPVEMIDDIKLIFSNSRTFNTNPRSKIYSMTARLSNQFLARSESFLKDWSNIAPLKRPLTRSIIRNIYENYLASQNHTVDPANQPTTSTHAHLMRTRSSESDINRSRHRYSLRRSDADRTTNRSNNVPHRYVTRNSSSSYSPNKNSQPQNEYEFGEPPHLSNNSSLFDEISNESNENSYHHNKNSNLKINKRTRSTYKVYKDVELAAPSTSSTSLNFKNKNNTSANSNQRRATRGNPRPPSTLQDDDDTNLTDRYFGNVSPITNPATAARRSNRIRKRREDYLDSYSVVEDPDEDQNSSKYNLRRSKRRFS